MEGEVMQRQALGTFPFAVIVRTISPLAEYGLAPLEDVLELGRARGPLRSRARPQGHNIPKGPRPPLPPTRPLHGESQQLLWSSILRNLPLFIGWWLISRPFVTRMSRSVLCWVVFTNVTVYFFFALERCVLQTKNQKCCLFFQTSEILLGIIFNTLLQNTYKTRLAHLGTSAMAFT